MSARRLQPSMERCAAEAAAEKAYWMLGELKEMRLVVVKIDGLRRAVEHNPPWYSDLCAKNERPKPKKHRTIIKRAHVIRTLKAFMHSTVDLGTVYAQRLLPYLWD